MAASAFVLYTAGFAAWVFWGGGSVRHRTVVSDVAFLPAGVLVGIFAWAASRHPGLPSRVQRGWRLIARAGLAWGIGDILWWYLEVVRHTSPFPSVADFCYLSFYPLLLAGLSRVAPVPLDAPARLRLALDALTVTVVAALVTWSVALGPTLSQHHHFLARVLNVAYPVGDVLVAFGVAIILVRRPPATTAAPLRVLMAGASMFVLADLWYARTSLEGSYRGGDIPDALWMIALALFLVSAQVQWSTAGRPARVARRAATSHISVVPYVAVVAAIALLTASGGHRAADVAVLASGAFAVVVLVSVRQVLALWDNARLTLELQGFVDDIRTEQVRNQRFLANAAHQLRTPVTGIQASAEALLRGTPAEQQEALVHSIGLEAAKAGRLVNDLVTMARLDMGMPLQRTPSDILAACEAEAARAEARTLGIEVTVRRPEAPLGPLPVDEAGLRAILANLLAHTSQRARHCVEVAVGRSGAGVEVCVRDDGPVTGSPGANGEVANDLFEPFDPAGDPNAQGLGLAIARGYARAHGGDLCYVDGAFVVSLPAPV